MKISLPASVQSAFKTFASQGTFGPNARKEDGPGTDVTRVEDFFGKMLDLQLITSLDQTGADLDVEPNRIQCKPEALEEMGKPYGSWEAEIEGNPADPESVLIHRTEGPKETFEYLSTYQGATYVLTATIDGADVAIGSLMMQVKDGEPVGVGGIPVIDGESLSEPHGGYRICV